ncbi:MAG: hypothetical protein ACPG3X_06515 [Opitutales bacterium]
MKLNTRFVLALFGISLGAVFQFTDFFPFDDNYNDFESLLELTLSPESVQGTNFMEPPKRMSGGRKIALWLSYSIGVIALVMGFVSAGLNKPAASKDFQA